MMKAPPQIHSLYIAKLAGEPMMQIERADIIAGEGIVGDRYAAGIGAFSVSKPKIRHISLITLSGLAEANRQLLANQHTPFSEGDTRRNMVINHLSTDELNSLVGQTFYLGGLAFKGTELCVPCQRPAKLLARPDFIKAFEARGGIRAEALESGPLAAGDLLILPFARDK
jgi:MOSC domain-containing protein YiiM